MEAFAQASKEKTVAETVSQGTFVGRPGTSQVGAKRNTIFS
jgi:hypothetical protein